MTAVNYIFVTGCTDTTKFRFDCTRACTDANLGEFYCPPGSRQWACHACTFPALFTSEQGPCVTRADCYFENLILRPTLATFPPAPTTPTRPATIIAAENEATSNAPTSTIRAIEPVAGKNNHRF